MVQLAFWMTVILTVAVDWWTKGAAFAYHLEAHGLLAEKHPVVMWDWQVVRFSFVREYNAGMAFGWLEDAQNSHVYVGAARACVTLGMIWFASRIRTGRLALGSALGAIAGGATGNLLDNIFHAEFQHEHTVRDFLLVSAGERHLPAFNIADVCVGIGALYLLASRWAHMRAVRRVD